MRTGECLDDAALMRSVYEEQHDPNRGLAMRGHHKGVSGKTPLERGTGEG